VSRIAKTLAILAGLAAFLAVVGALFFWIPGVLWGAFGMLCGMAAYCVVGLAAFIYAEFT
jgi:predicted PurR-regulated permease PerM